jgi:hypothetical protein
MARERKLVNALKVCRARIIEAGQSLRHLDEMLTDVEGRNDELSDRIASLTGKRPAEAAPVKPIAEAAPVVPPVEDGPPAPPTDLEA